MVTIQVKNIEGKTDLPIAGSEVAAGYDIIAVDDPIIVGDSVTKAGEAYPFYNRIDYIEYHTALYISPQSSNQVSTHGRDAYHTLLHPRSSIRKYNLVLANSIGLIDNDYRGEIIMCYKYLWQPEDFIMEYDNREGTKSEPTGKFLGVLNRQLIYKKGDRIGQLVAELTNPIKFILVNELDATARGEGGFGSTDSKPATPPVMGINKNGTLTELYQKAGGIPIKKRYADEIRERNQ